MQTGDVFRKEAKTYSDAVDPLIDGAEFRTSARQQALFVVGKTTANMLNAMADMVDILTADRTLTEAEKQDAAAAEKQNEVRMAAAKALASGDWSEFDDIVSKRAE
ncbi:MAG TPA: hypothetical protein VMX74_09080 [Pirellulales bacterium]|nr:hypothetical protein [Pirellulales bacterium]